MANNLPTSLSVPKATPCDFRLGDLVGDDVTVDFLGETFWVRIPETIHLQDPHHKSRNPRVPNGSIC